MLGCMTEPHSAYNPTTEDLQVLASNYVTRINEKIEMIRMAERALRDLYAEVDWLLVDATNHGVIPRLLEESGCAYSAQVIRNRRNRFKRDNSRTKESDHNAIDDPLILHEAGIRRRPDYG